MNILFLSRLFYPHIGGVEKHVLEISRELMKKGHRIIVITEQHDKNLKLEEEIEGIEVYRIPVGKDSFFKKFRIWRQLWEFRKLIKNADIVHCHDVFFWYLPFRLLYPRKPVYTTFHGYETYPIPKKAILVRKISEILSRGNICIGQFMKKWYGTKPTYVSYGGAKVSEKRPFGFAQGGQVKSEKQVERSAVFVGRLDEQTGFLTYLEAVKKIKKKFPDFKFTVFGDGKFNNKIGKDIDFRGFVGNYEKELPKFNFVFASRYLSILEAMAAKRLVFAVYDNPVKEDYLKMSPFAKYIIIANSADEIVQKVVYFLENPKEEELIGKAFEWAKKQSWENLSNTYINLWQRNK
ncbi:MAG: glycosyltransferase family 4 protein [Candidatus Levybacteria bacterium]|nr:glycosyltransferase family 4 protein [Candidatus Levybacteria bacterium]